MRKRKIYPRETDRNAYSNHDYHGINRHFYSIKSKVSATLVSPRTIKERKRRFR